MTQLMAASAGGNLTQQGLLPRATYAIASASSEGAAGYLVNFLDSEFRRLTAGFNTGYYGNVGSQDDVTPNQYQNAFYGANTNRIPSAQSGLQINGVTGVSEFGNDGFVASERGLLMPVSVRHGTSGLGGVRNTQAFVNSDHSDKTKVLMFHGGYLTVAPLFRPRSRYVTADYSPERKEKSVAVAVTGGQVTSMVGSASYNNVRKELVALVYNPATTGQYDVYIWKNFDLDANGMDISLLPNAPTATFSVNVITGGGGTTGYGSEAQYSPKPVLCDNGDIIFTALWTSSAVKVFRIARATGDASGTLTLLANNPVNGNQYGNEQGTGYGAKTMQSRDGRLVATYTSFIYYSTGMTLSAVDRRTATYITFVSGTTDVGASLVKYRDDSLAWCVNTSGYAAQFTTPVIYPIVPRPGTSPLVQTAPIHPASVYYGGNSTYLFSPVISHVWEYNLQGLAAV